MKHSEGVLYAQTVGSLDLEDVVKGGGNMVGNKREVYEYVMRDHRKIVQYGVTRNPDSRPSDHIRDGKRFSKITYDSHPRTWKSAKREETRRIQTYQKTHNNKKPRYNKIC